MIIGSIRDRGLDKLALYGGIVRNFTGITTVDTVEY
jgi:hypothetical protein